MIRPPLFSMSIILLGLSFISPVSNSAVETGDLPQRIVQEADRIRFPADGFQVDVTIRNFSKGIETGTRQYRIISKGNNRTVVMVTAPAADRGQIMLMRDQDLWVFMPNVSRPIRLPLSQRLSGQVANGDLARANFSDDYTSKLLRVENIEGNDYYVLELLAARRGVTYQRVHYWVNKKSYKPYKAEFFTISKRRLKVVYYQEYSRLDGAIRPTKLVMHDMLRKGDYSVMEYSNMKQRALPDKVFTKQYLKKLK